MAHKPVLALGFTTFPIAFELPKAYYDKLVRSNKENRENLGLWMITLLSFPAISWIVRDLQNAPASTLILVSLPIWAYLFAVITLIVGVNLWPKYKWYLPLFLVGAGLIGFAFR
ncbi:MAG: hypothetical protein DRI61_17650 [Chloroflexi bacterium]|nr:MAG: hypothetical protein DRI61_17650 [Chloroflexota bacterium]